MTPHTALGRAAASLRRRVATALVGLTCVVCPLGFTWSARATEVKANVGEILSQSAGALEEGQPSEAIRTLEAVADRGTHHPDLSFNRGVAYLWRGKSPAAQSGDVGQAAAGFAETLQWRASDAEAQRGLEEAQLLMARKKSHADTSAENQTLGLLERVMLHINPWIFLSLAALASLGVSGGMLLRRAERESLRLSGNIALLVGGLILVPVASLAGIRHLLFAEARAAVVVSDSVAVVDAGGGRIPGRLPLREGTVVHVGPTRHGRAPLVSLVGSAEVPLSGLRFLKTPTP